MVASLKLIHFFCSDIISAVRDSCESSKLLGATRYNKYCTDEKVFKNFLVHLLSRPFHSDLTESRAGIMAQRPKRNNSPINLKHQPLKATVPLSSLVRNTSPIRRRTSPSSPGLPSDKRNKYRRSPDVNNTSEHRNLFSPLGSKG